MFNLTTAIQKGNHVVINYVERSDVQIAQITAWKGQFTDSGQLAA